MTKQEFARLTSSGIVYLDGATGSNLFKAGMPRGMSTEAWVLEHPGVLEDLQRAYIEAGSQIIYAPTFGANRHVLAGFGLDGNVEDMNKRLVDISRRAADGKARIAGDIAPTGMLLESIGGDYTDEQMVDVYTEQISCLADAGVDLLVCETMMSVEEVCIALDAAHAAAADLPVMCTLTVTADGRAFYGGTATEAAETLTEMGADAVGINCCAGPDQLESIVRGIAKVTDLPVIAKPNAGMPVIDKAGNAAYNMGPAEFAKHMKVLVDAGASIVGGCCGTTPEYIRRLRILLDTGAVLL